MLFSWTTFSPDLEEGSGLKIKKFRGEMIPMSRREEKRQKFASSLMPQKHESDAAPLKKSDKLCGTCKNYSESSFASDGRGSCKYLKLGSDITGKPPVYITEGKEGYLTKTLADASSCEHYQKMKMIDKDGYECSDPMFRRSMRQFQE
ncbi:MAG: hypothetical protein C0403_12275 [Desulfobacterium sp.]|nr:hypothetical protein [Desulfobacterium sp.]